MDYRRAEDAEAGLEFVAASQRAELMAARAAESDLDLAYRLQLQEAMAASLAAFSSSSSSSSSPSSAPPPPPTDPKAHASDPEDDYLSHVLDLQVLELERFNQERTDDELREAELRRASAEMRRRVHDERFARALEAIPDDEWEEFGDNFERPFDGPSLNGQEEEEEPFRLYFKGMASTGHLRGARVQLAAVGVAVCDPADNLVLKVQKPLAVGIPGTGREVLEAKALVEGLTAVISLGIKRVNVFFDSRVLYNHVTGTWRVKQRKVANTIDQVYLLQRKLERCAMFLLPRCHVKFAFKLAREAIDMQITKNVDLNGDVSLRQTCGICLEDTDPSQMSSIDGCLHKFCFSCMKQHVEVKLLHAMLPGCPHDGCNVMLNLESSKKFLSPRLYEIMSHRIKEASIPAAEKVYCPYPRCSALMSRSETIFPQQDSSSKQYGSDISGLRKCIKCNGSFCINCKVPWHDRMSCYDYKRLNPHPRAEDARLQTLAKQKLWRQCLKCNHMIELAEGCYHITCRCGYEFCYTCGAEWKNKKATCSCPLWDEGYIWYDNDEDDDSEEEFYDDEDDTYDSYDDEYDTDDYLH